MRKVVFQPVLAGAMLVSLVLAAIGVQAQPRSTTGSRTADDIFCFTPTPTLIVTAQSTGTATEIATQPAVSTEVATVSATEAATPEPTFVSCSPTAAATNAETQEPTEVRTGEPTRTPEATDIHSTRQPEPSQT